MRKLKKQLKKLHKTSAPADGFRAALWAELDYEFDKTHATQRSSFSFARFVAMPIAGMAVVTLMGTGTFAYASADVNSTHVLYPTKIAIENVESVFHRSPESKARYHARMMERRIDEGEAMLRNKKTVAVSGFDQISVQYDKAIDVVEESVENTEDREIVMAYLKTSNVRYLHLMRLAMEAEIDALEPDEIEGVIQVLARSDINSAGEQTVTPLAFKTKAIDGGLPEVKKIAVEDAELTERQKRIEEISEKLYDIRVKINESNLTEEEKRALLREFEQKLLERFMEVSKEMDFEFEIIFSDDEDATAIQFEINDSFKLFQF